MAESALPDFTTVFAEKVRRRLRSEAATAQPRNKPTPGSDNSPTHGGDTTLPSNGRPQSPRRLRSLIVGLIIAALLAILLFVVLRPESESTNPALGVGDTAPNFALPRLGGGAPVNLDALGVDRHRPVILNFFASWCEACQTETPLMGNASTAAKATGSPVQFIGIDVNDPLTSSANSFVKQSGVSYPVGSDLTLRVSSVLYTENGLPTTFFIDGSGHVIGVNRGPLNATQLAQWMKRLTGGGSASGPAPDGRP